MDTREAAAFLETRVELFAGFPREALDGLVAGSRLDTFETNEAIIEFGEEGRFLGVLLDGQVEASVADDAGERHRLAVFQPGEVFGEMSLMTGDKTVADVIALVRSTVLLVPQPLVSAVIMSHPSCVRLLSRVITTRLRTTALGEAGRELAEAALRRNEDPYGFRLKTEQPMKLLVVNCGSSSLKYDLFNTADEARNAKGTVERIGDPRGMRHSWRSAAGRFNADLPAGSHREAFDAMLAALLDPERGALVGPREVSAVGHRVVHGGSRFAEASVITEEVEKEIEALAGLAPLHNPVNLLGVREARRRFPDAPQVAVFDTAFHHTLPPYAYLYGLPREYAETKQVRRFGFHGTSHFYVALRAAQFLKRPFNALEIISCHLGNGASVCAVDHGRSVDTSMGLTPAEGLMMGTRCGDIDPGALLHIIRTEGLTVAQGEDLINKRSGLKGLSGVSNDMREVEKAAAAGDASAILALKTFSYRVRKYIGAYIAAMGNVDVLVFTGGIGQGSAAARSLACQGLACMGLQIDEAKNRAARGFEEPSDIAVDGAAARILVVPTDEERMIARETLRAVSRHAANVVLSARKHDPIPIEISAHHVHLAADHVERLFGAGHRLTPEAPLSQPGQFASAERVSLVGPKGRVERVRVLGPERKATQVEIALTEQFKLGIHPPIRESGDLANTPGITLEGPAGTVTVDQGVICALRHVHMAPEDALRFGVRDRDRVRVRVGGDREMVFGDVLVRVSPDYRLAMHLDTDEGNAANLQPGAAGLLDGIESQS